MPSTGENVILLTADKALTASNPGVGAQSVVGRNHHIVLVMPDSDYVFETGDPIAVGNHGATNYLSASGEPVLNGGISEFVFESGEAIVVGSSRHIVLWNK